jgi:hypothetical protein
MQLVKHTVKMQARERIVNFKCERKLAMMRSWVEFLSKLLFECVGEERISIEMRNESLVVEYYVGTKFIEES